MLPLLTKVIGGFFLQFLTTKNLSIVKEHFETLAIRTQLEQTAQKEHSVPLYLTSSFTFDSAEHGAQLFNNETEGNLYSRFANPNTQELIDKLAILEGTQDGIVTASGMAAVYTSFAALLKMGDHIIACKSIFGNSKYILNSILPNSGIEVTYVGIHDNAAWEAAFRPNTKMVFLETPSNPTLITADMTFIGKLCKQHGAIFSVDNCFATPYLQQPVKFGADLIIHSATKYIDGQGRVLGGAILGSKELVGKCFDFVRRTGASLSPFNAWILSKSLETLAVRMDRHCSNAAALALYLAQHQDVDYISYPHADNNPMLAVAKAQMSQGGGLVGCQVSGGAERGARFLNALKMHSLTANLGDTRSIATHPASTTHSKLTLAEQLEVDITPGYLRFSVGLEHIDDIIADIEKALHISK
jgi:O-succinylhomoserine sulfhydrylase